MLIQFMFTRKCRRVQFLKFMPSRFEPFDLFTRCGSGRLTTRRFFEPLLLLECQSLASLGNSLPLLGKPIQFLGKALAVGRNRLALLRQPMLFLPEGAAFLR